MAKVSTDQQKKGFSQIKKKRQEKGNIVSPPVQQQVVVKPKEERRKEKQKKPMGRGTHKPPGANEHYVRIGALVPEEFRDRMKSSLLNYLKGAHKSMDEMIYVAIKTYLDSKDPNAGK